VGCGFNLHGQPIVREAHYGLVMVRCPECAQVAALQEYPSLGKWAGRLAGAGALLWLVIVLAAIIGTGVFVHQRSRQTAIDVLHPGAMRLGEAYRVFAKAKAEELPDPAQRQQTIAWLDSNTVLSWPMVGAEFVGTPDYEAALAAIAPGARVDYMGARTAGWIGLSCLVIGAGCAVLTPHLRRTGLAVLVGVIMLVAMGAWGVSMATPSSIAAWGGYAWSSDLMADRYGAPLMPIGLFTAAIGLYAGMLIGRPIARWLLVLLLPPRLLSAFGALWTLHGLRVPGGRGSPRVRGGAG